MVNLSHYGKWCTIQRTMVNDQHLKLSQLSSTVALCYLWDRDINDARHRPTCLRGSWGITSLWYVFV